jgi:hypothetical protein
VSLLHRAVLDVAFDRPSSSVHLGEPLCGRVQLRAETDLSPLVPSPVVLPDLMAAWLSAPRVELGPVPVRPGEPLRVRPACTAAREVVLQSARAELVAFEPWQEQLDRDSRSSEFDDPVRDCQEMVQHHSHGLVESPRRLRAGETVALAALFPLPGDAPTTLGTEDVGVQWHLRFVLDLGTAGEWRGGVPVRVG